jgi:predicted ATPase
MRGVSLDIPATSGLVCLVGENGTGKSNLLELLAAAAHEFGLSAGLQISRGNPLEEEHSISVVLQLSESTVAGVRQKVQQNRGAHSGWDGTLHLTSESGRPHRKMLTAGGVPDVPTSQSVAQLAITYLRERTDTYYLYLDADRAYPPNVIDARGHAEALGHDWESVTWRKGRAYLPTRTLYDEWIKYFLARETQGATKYTQQARRAEEQATAPPRFQDYFREYKDAVRKVLPHLMFNGVDTRERTLLFDTADVELSFKNLSGGEREIAFLLGQIDRFALRRGLLLVDEPELHLNPDLIRAWIAYLRDTVQDGQVWIATHSLEAAEVAGTASSFVLERAPEGRSVVCAAPLANRPVLAALSAALGSPAFSTRRLRFIYVEGDRQTRERERFYSLCGDDSVNRFMEGGGCTEVVRRVTTVRELARECSEAIRVGGVIDRDFRTPACIAEEPRLGTIHVLGCHEVENLFLHPASIQAVLRQLGKADMKAAALLVDASDHVAGSWVFERTYARHEGLPQPSPLLKERIRSLKWRDLSSASIEDLVPVEAGMDAQLKRELVSGLSHSIAAYRDLRTSDRLWAECLGKEVTALVARDIGYRSADVFESSVVQLWRTRAVTEPAELTDLRAYIARI